MGFDGPLKLIGEEIDGSSIRVIDPSDKSRDIVVFDGITERKKERLLCQALSARLSFSNHNIDLCFIFALVLIGWLQEEVYIANGNRFRAGNFFTN